VPIFTVMVQKHVDTFWHWLS